MKELNLGDVYKFLDKNLAEFYQAMVKSLNQVKLETLLQKLNPHLPSFRYCKSVSELIPNLLETTLVSYEEELFDNLLKDLAVFIADKTCAGYKSTTSGIDLEFFNKDVYYVVSIKSGISWGNSSQHSKLEQDLKNAVARLKQSKHSTNVQPVLGICYGKTRTSYVRGYLKVVGQNFWYLISENRDLYTDIIEPIGYKAREHNEIFLLERSRVINLFTKMFIDQFCDDTGAINWVKLVEFNSGNYDLDKSLL